MANFYNENLFRKLDIDLERSEVRLNGQIVDLTALEFELLRCLVNHPDRNWKRSDLMHEVWGYEWVGDPRVVDVHLGQILKKIGDVDDADGTAPLLKPRRPHSPSNLDDAVGIATIEGINNR